MTNTASLETVLRTRSQIYKQRQYIDMNGTFAVAKQRKRVRGAVAPYAELRAHV